MPHLKTDEFGHLNSRTKHAGRGDILKLKHANSIKAQYEQIRDQLDGSALASSLTASLNARLATSRSPITRVVSLGLGSFTKHSKDQARRLKQLVIFTFIVDYLNDANNAIGMPNLEIFAQDPTFTKSDSDILNFFDVQVIKTPSPSELGQAQHIIDRNTLVYSPFLTIEAYEALFESSSVRTLIGDDFQALKRKFDRGTADHKSVEALSRAYMVAMRRRAVSGDGFWDMQNDTPFPLAIYWSPDAPRRDSKL